MPICINYYGQPRELERTKRIYDEFLASSSHDVYICYTTWDTESIQEFRKLFPNSYIRQIPVPDTEALYSETINRFSIDPSNRSRKSMAHYILGLYIKKHSYYMIEQLSSDIGATFDIVVSLRTDVYLYDCIIKDQYDDMLKTFKTNTVFVANAPKFNIYGEFGLPDVFYISDMPTMKKILFQLDILEECVVPRKRFFHPETSFHVSLVRMGLSIIELPLRAFPQSM
jgi:hypothetical protein